MSENRILVEGINPKTGFFKRINETQTTTQPNHEKKKKESEITNNKLETTRGIKPPKHKKS